MTFDHLLPTSATVAALAFALAAPLGAARSATDTPAQQARERQVAVTVLSADGTPIPGLTPADFTVSEDGRTREVLRVAPNVPPSHVALLVDNSQATSSLVRELREGLTSLVTRLSDTAAPPEFQLTTFGDRPTVLAAFASPRTALDKAVAHVVPQAGAGARLLEAILETCRDLTPRHAPHPVILAFVAEAGPEFSDQPHEEVANALKAVGAELWTIVLQSRGGDESAGPARERAIVLGDVTRQSGGMNKIVLAAPGVAQAFGSVATALASTYDVTYSRPESFLPPKRLDVRVSRPGTTVLATQWAPQ